MSSDAATFVWLVPADHPAFPGHFPGRPILPGVVLVDRAILFAREWLSDPGTGCHIASAKFFSPVGPADVLNFTFAVKTGGGVACAIHCGERAVATLALAFSGQDKA